MTLPAFLAALRDGAITLEAELAGEWLTPTYRASNGWRVGKTGGEVAWVEIEGRRVWV